MNVDPGLAVRSGWPKCCPAGAEFGGIVTNLESELRRYGVTVHLNTELTLAEACSGDAVILATGAKPHMTGFSRQRCAWRCPGLGCGGKPGHPWARTS